MRRGLRRAFRHGLRARVAGKWRRPRRLRRSGRLVSPAMASNSAQNLRKKRKIAVLGSRSVGAYSF